MIYDRVLTENEAESFYDSNIAPENGISYTIIFKKERAKN